MRGTARFFGLTEAVRAARLRATPGGPVGGAPGGVAGAGFAQGLLATRPRTERPLGGGRQAAIRRGSEFRPSFRRFRLAMGTSKVIVLAMLDIVLLSLQSKAAGRRNNENHDKIASRERAFSPIRRSAKQVLCGSGHGRNAAIGFRRDSTTCRATIASRCSSTVRGARLGDWPARSPITLRVRPRPAIAALGMAAGPDKIWRSTIRAPGIGKPSRCRSFGFEKNARGRPRDHTMFFCSRSMRGRVCCRNSPGGTQSSRRQQFATQDSSGGCGL